MHVTKTTLYRISCKTFQKISKHDSYDQELSSDRFGENRWRMKKKTF